MNGIGLFLDWAWRADLSPDAAHWSDRLNRVQRSLKLVSGRWVEAQVAPGITGLQVVLALVVGALWLGLHAGLRRATRRAGARAAEPDRPVPESLARLLARDAMEPVLLALGILGGYAIGCLLCFRLPDYSKEVLDVFDWLRASGLVGAALWFIFRLIGILEILLVRWSAASARRWEAILVPVLIRALRLVVPLLGVLLIVPTLDLPDRWHEGLQELASLALMAFVGISLCDLTTTAEASVLASFRIDVRDNLVTRKVQTQVRILKQIAVVLILAVTLASMLTVFGPVRALGHSILASAGVAGIVLGIAAQRTLGLFLAGIQIAFTQPIRLDDVVIAEGEWGRVEEITLTYVVVALWDQRRLVLPITYFIEKPFQNWTRSTAELLGTVFLYLDYTIPLGPLRGELDRILQHSEKWDGRTKALQVTDARESTIEIRILASAADSGRAFDLRCEVREKLIEFVRVNHPHALPTKRLQWQSPDGPTATRLPRRTGSAPGTQPGAGGPGPGSGVG